QDGVTAVPQCDGETDVLVTVADSRDPVLVPAVGSGPGLVMRKILPGIAVWTVIFADGAPGTLAQVGTPALPVGALFARFFQPELFSCHVCILSISTGTHKKPSDSAQP